MAPPKRHHYLPEMYLAGFTDDGTSDGNLHVYFRKTDEVKPMKPLNTGVIGHWYSMTREDGSKDPSLEEWLGQMEGRAAPGLKKLRRGGETLTPGERMGVAEFIAFLWTRGPDLHKTLEDIQQVLAEQLENFLPRNGVEELASHPHTGDDESVLRLEDLRPLMKDGRVELPREKSIPPMLDLATGIVRLVWEGNWMVYRASPATSFLTSDCPVIPVPQELGNRGFYPRAPLDSDVPKIVPISSSALLAFSGEGGGQGERVIGKSRVRAYNVLIATRAGDYVVARDEAHVRSVVARAHLRERGEKPRIWPQPLRSRPASR